MPANMLSVLNVVIDRYSVVALARALSRIYILKEESDCYAASRRCVSARQLPEIYDDIGSFRTVFPKVAGPTQRVPSAI
jgi:hypothetical protein